jgi:flagellar basal-body rod protein FlgG
MLEGLYSAAAGMEAQQQRLDSIANDISNIDTPGYQSERVGFENLLYNAAAPTQGSGVSVGAGAQALNLGPSQAASALQTTGQPLDLAIAGDAYLEVKEPGGTTALTRDGQLQLDAKGQLTTSSGLIVQPPITVPAGVTPSDITIASDGTLSSGGKTFGKLALVTVPAPEQLTPIGDGLLVTSTASGSAKPASGASVIQGSLNASNVDLASALTELTDAQNTYSMTSKAISIEAQMLQIANQVRG